MPAPRTGRTPVGTMLAHAPGDYSPGDSRQAARHLTAPRMALPVALVEQGACVLHPDPDLWFRAEDEAEAVAVCAGCAVADVCRRYADENGIVDGVWGSPSRRRPWTQANGRRVPAEVAAAARARKAGGETVADLAREYGLSRTTLAAALRRAEP